MSLRALVCPACGAPLPSNARRAVVVCPFCKASVTDDGPVILGMSFRRALADLDAVTDTSERRVRVAGLPYRVLGRIAQGESSDVFLAERARAVTERVILKVLRADSDRDLQDREWEALTALEASDAQGSVSLSRRLPSPVARGRVEGSDRTALLTRAQSGFVDTFEDVLRAYPRGVDGRHAAWMWRRILELLGWVHQAGWAHGAILPAHLVVQARDHGVMLVGWSCAARLGGREPLPVVNEARLDFYPEPLLRGAPPGAKTDIAMSARCVAWVLGGSATSLPPSVPAPFRDLILEQAGGGAADDAWALRRRVGVAAEEAFGPPRFHPFEMP